MLKASPVYADYLATLAKNHTLPVAGIILGMTRSQRPDTIVHMCRLFKSEDEPLEGDAAAGSPEIDEDERKEQLVFDVEDIMHMLTPGIEVLGTFVVCKSDDVVKDPAAWDRVKLIYRVIRKLCVDASKHYLLIHSGATEAKGKTSCKLVVGDKPNLDKNELKSVAVEFSDKDKDAYKLVQLNAQYSLTRSHFLRSFELAGGEHGQMKGKKLREMLCSGLEKTLNSALITFNGEIPGDKQKVEDVVANQDRGDRSSKAAVIVEIYEKNIPIADDEDVKRSSDLLQLKGCVASRLFVYPDDSLAYVEALLRKDLLQSITQRIQRATELGQDSEDNDKKDDVIALSDLSDRMGRRIYFTIQPSNIQLFDYLYPDESEDELRERINHKLDIDVEVTDIYFDLEEDGQGRNSFIETIDQKDGTRAGASQLTAQPGNRKMLFLFIRFAVIAIAAIVIPLVFNNSKKDSDSK